MSAPAEHLVDLVLGEVVQFYDDWQACRVYIAPGAFRAMVARLSALDKLQSLSELEALQYARLWAFFSLIERDDPEFPSPTG
jgi:hypothetical protein